MFTRWYVTPEKKKPQTEVVKKSDIILNFEM